MTDHTVVVGAGHAAGQLAVSLRVAGYTGALTIVGEEAVPPYQRPPLSKGYLSGDVGLDRLLVKPLDFYTENDIQLQLNTTVTAIDPAARSLHTTGGELQWRNLVIATGSRARTLAVPGSTLTGVHYLRTAADVDRIRGAFTPGKRLVIIGGGYIGLEVAAVAIKAGLEVHIVERESRLLSRVVSPQISDFYLDVHRTAGAHIHLGTQLASFGGAQHVDAVQLDDGVTLPADLVIVGVGVEPNTELADAAGITCDNGIVVNEFCETSADGVLAIGDCTNHPNPLLDRNLRLESVPNALEQARTAAATITGARKAYAQVPWFWSDQYDLKLQIVGLTDGYDATVIRGDMATRRFACFYLAEGRLIAVDAVNSPREFMFSKPLVAARAKVSPELLADPQQSLKDIAVER
ncbi:MAG: FAD-dependent oxidoreductase [Pseudomonadota bacterium]